MLFQEPPWHPTCNIEQNDVHNHHLNGDHPDKDGVGGGGGGGGGGGSESTNAHIGHKKPDGFGGILQRKAKQNICQQLSLKYFAKSFLLLAV